MLVVLAARGAEVYVTSTQALYYDWPEYKASMAHDDVAEAFGMDWMTYMRTLEQEPARLQAIASGWLTEEA